MPHGMDDRVLEHLLDRVRLAPAAQELLGEMLVVEPGAVLLPVRQGVGLELVQGGKDDVLVTEELTCFLPERLKPRCDSGDRKTKPRGPRWKARRFSRRGGGVF